MGSLFSSNSASQATTNSQVGAQGGSGTTSTVGSGNAAPVAGGNNATATGALTAYGTGNQINITTSDVEALHTVDDVTHDALAANQAVSLDSVNAANQVAINALGTVESVAGQNASTANNAVAAAQNIAGQAAPVSEGNLALGLEAQNQGTTSKQIEVGVAVALVTGLVYYLAKGHKV